MKSESTFRYVLCIASLVCGITAGAQTFGEDYHLEVTMDLSGVTTAPLSAAIARNDRSALRLEGGFRYFYKGTYGIGVQYGVEEKTYGVIRQKTHDADFESQGYRIEALIISDPDQTLQAGVTASYLFGRMNSMGQVRTESGYFDSFVRDFSREQRYSGFRVECLFRTWLTDFLALELGTGFTAVLFNQSNALYPAYLVPMTARSLIVRDDTASALHLRLGLTARF